MRRFTTTLILVTGVFCIVQSCRKEYSSVVINPGDQNATLSYSEKNFSISNHVDLILKTPTGLKIHFPAYAFVNKLGQPVTDNINVEVKEILKPDAMILYNMPSVSDGRPLESGGEFFIGATSSGEKLQLAPGVFIRLDLPKTGVKMDGMQVFNGAKNFSNSPDSINWVLNTNRGNFVTLDSSVFSVTALFCDSIGWLNCDRISPEQTIEYTINPGNTPDADSTIVYVHLSGRNTVMGAYKQGSSTIFKAMVIESPATIIGICVRNGELYASISQASLKTSQSTAMNFTMMTKEQLTQKLKGLR